jgi:hypothetical protein
MLLSKDNAPWSIWFTTLQRKDRALGAIAPTTLATARRCCPRRNRLRKLRPFVLHVANAPFYRPQFHLIGRVGGLFVEAPSPCFTLFAVSKSPRAVKGMRKVLIAWAISWWQARCFLTANDRNGTVSRKSRSPRRRSPELTCVVGPGNWQRKMLIWWPRTTISA